MPGGILTEISRSSTRSEMGPPRAALTNGIATSEVTACLGGPARTALRFSLVEDVAHAAEPAQAA